MSLRRTVTVTLAIAALTLVGCGSSNNGTSLGPDTAPPSTPSILKVHSREGTVVIAWAPNVEADLAGYNVYLASTPPEKMNTSLIMGSSFLLIPGNSGTYRYRVTAVDRTGNESAPSPMILVNIGQGTGTIETPGKDGITQAW